MMDFSTMSYADLFILRYSTEGWNFPLDTKNLWDVKKNAMRQENKYKKGNALYVHIPFCVRRCDFCSWHAVAYNKSRVANYINALTKEISTKKDAPYIKSTEFSSLYFGGGTPSILSIDEIDKVMISCHETFNIAKNAEITFEANPSTLTQDKIKALKDAKVTRISLGIQSFNDEVLKKSNCSHTAQQARKTIDSILEAGFLLNIDVIYGLIGQTVSDWQWELQKLCEIMPPQATIYPLRLFQDTSLYLELKKKVDFDFEEHENILKEYGSIGEEFLESHFYNRSEFPYQYAKKGVPVHRYRGVVTRVVGFGASAGSFLDIGESRNEYDVDKYISEVNQGEEPIGVEITLTQEQVYERFILFRIFYTDNPVPTAREITAEKFKEFFDVEMGSATYNKVINDLIQKYKLIDIKDNRFEPSSKLRKYLDNFKIYY